MKGVGIINYGMGNIASVQNALKYIGKESFVIDTAEQLSEADKLILPGVGAFPMAMDNLRTHGFVEALNHEIASGKPLLGLCLGMQLLFESSLEFGEHTGLGYIPGTVLPLNAAEIGHPVPHMGWNNLEFKELSPILSNIPENASDMYFVHSFYCKATHREHVSATVNYGVEMDVVVKKEHLFGCQFHPEKSQKYGLQILQNFCDL